jgi:SAM-dependent methyltransferase
MEDQQWTAGLAKMTSICRLCGKQGSPTTLHLREMMFGTRESFTYEQCETCGSLQIQAIPADLERYYPPSYHAYKPPPRMRWFRKLALRAANRRSALVQGGSNLGFRMLQRLPRGGFSARVHPLAPLRGKLASCALRIADVGGASGQLLAELRNAGFTDLTCIDPFYYGPSQPGIRFLRQELHTVEADFDVIMYHHTLEHVADIPSELAAIRSRLRPHGFALLRFPIVPNAAFNTYREHWVQLDPPRHLHIPSRMGLEMAAGRTGLEVVESGDDSTDFQFWASELYVRGVGLHEADSVGGAKAFFSSAQLHKYRREAMALNAARRGDQAWFILRASSGDSLEVASRPMRVQDKDGQA